MRRTLLVSSVSVYVQKFDTGSGYVRVVRGRVDMAEYDANGVPQRYEIFHDRGRGVYSSQDVFYPIDGRWVNIPGRRGYAPVLLVASARDGVRFVGRDERGDLHIFHRDRDIFPIFSSDR